MIFFEEQLSLRSQTYGKVDNSCQSERTELEFDRREQTPRNTIVPLVDVMWLHHNIRRQPESVGRTSGSSILHSLQTKFVIEFRGRNSIKGGKSVTTRRK